jgi:hypothetical protein
MMKLGPFIVLVTMGCECRAYRCLGAKDACLLLNIDAVPKLALGNRPFDFVCTIHSIVNKLSSI